jgi:acid phosphatase (class B)
LTRRAFLVLAGLLVAAAGFLLTGCPKEQTRKEEPETPQIKSLKVGFDVDDTLLFSSPGFDRAKARKDVKPYSWLFWRIVNESDAELSTVKKKTREILEKHKAEGAEIFVVTARHPHGGEELMRYLYRELGVPPTHVFFETKGKAERLEELGIEIFYGDSDSDITAAKEAGAKGIRILRSPKSSYKGKYNPGKFGEEIIEGSEE